jgi:DNA-directed RNA polymerase subunit RPC12/RpoP
LTEKQFHCPQCAAQLEFDPDAGGQKCPYCGFETAVRAAGTVQELDFQAALEQEAGAAAQVETYSVKCGACGAESTLPPNVTASECPFCGTKVVATGQSRRIVQPRSLLPFFVTKDKAFESFRSWLRGLWFAPSRLKHDAAREDALNGIYIPYWTYDCLTTSDYTGERGDDYWTTETYHTTVNGKSVTRTRSVKKTRWRSVSGRVVVPFDDVLVLASQSLPQKMTEKLEPWDLKNLTPYRDEFLSGFRAESYTVGLQEGFRKAQGIMDGSIRAAVCSQIGGDHQRIHSLRTWYQNVTFKHVLLPIWISAYRFKKTVYRFLVNGRTGEVQGERPYSWVKILLAILGGIALVGGAVALIAGA